ncbi:creatine kinase [Plasmopara halstedii]|uniref:Creatine kinase n=1 Tax=Plasmopara halstedii TaxID=4781 RepID=A0A0N7L3I0_PLAHL|nr:creatine kinase [Plasmopara halstedii]CEG35931.1 creatine kinase [Plasmopara halstedii]|eukprot:XP_024572300.1 creatine kinase [Plasmopara halstedii]
MRVISLQDGGDVSAVFERFCRAIKSVEASIKAKGKEFIYNEHLDLIAMEQKLLAGEYIDALFPTDPIAPVIIDVGAPLGVDDALSSQEDSSRIFTSKHHSLMTKHLTKTLYDKLKDKHSSKEYTLDMAIQTSNDNPHLGVGVVAGDEECYQVFKDLYDPVIEGWHGYKPEDKHLTDMDVSKLKNAEKTDNAYVQSARVRAGRNIPGLSLPPGTTRTSRPAQEEHPLQA